jgi:hypothetical protein
VGVHGALLEGAKEKAQSFGQELDALASSLGTLAQISGDSFGGVVKGMSQVIGAASVATQAFESITKAAATMATNTASSIATMATGYAALISMGIQAGIAFVSMSEDVKRANAALDAFNASIYGTLTAAQKLEGGTRSCSDGPSATIQRPCSLGWRMPISPWGCPPSRPARMSSGSGPRAQTGTAPRSMRISTRRTAIIDAIHAMGISTEAELQAIADQSKAVFEYMERAGTYSAEQLATAWADFARKQGIALGEIDPAAVEGVTDALSALDEEFKRLSDSVADEAPERVMG